MSSNTPIKRYPTRKRKVVNYNVDVNSDEDLSEGRGPANINSDDGPVAHLPNTKRLVPNYQTRLSKRPTRKAKPGKSFVKFMDLPGEIRNMIYKMALTDPSGAIHIVHDWDGPRRDIARHRLFLGIGKRPFSPNQNLLATSKTVRGEALGFLYHQPFIFEDPRALKEFMLLMTPTTVAQLRDIALGFYDSMLSTDCFRLLRGAVGLRKLKLLGSFRTYPVPTTYRMLYKRDTISALTLATRFYDMFYCFIQTFTAQHGVDALMDVVELPHMDLHDDEYSTAVPMGTTPDHVACMDEREKRILAEVKEHITRWVNKFPEL